MTFLNKLVFWKTTQFHALAARQPLVPVLGLSQSSLAPLQDDYSLVRAPNGMNDYSILITQRKNAYNFLCFSNLTLIKEICLSQGSKLPKSPYIQHCPKVAPSSILHNSQLPPLTKVSLSISEPSCKKLHFFHYLNPMALNFYA